MSEQEDRAREKLKELLNQSGMRDKLSALHSQMQADRLQQDANKARVRKAMQDLADGEERNLDRYLRRLADDPEALGKLVEEISEQLEGFGLVELTMDGKTEKLARQAVKNVVLKYRPLFENGDVSCLKRKWWQFWK